MCHFFIGTTYEIKNNEDDNSINRISMLTNKLQPACLSYCAYFLGRTLSLSSVIYQVQFQFKIRNLPSFAANFPGCIFVPVIL